MYAFPMYSDEYVIVSKKRKPSTGDFFSNIFDMWTILFFVLTFGMFNTLLWKLISTQQGFQVVLCMAKATSHL